MSGRNTRFFPKPPQSFWNICKTSLNSCSYEKEGVHAGDVYIGTIGNSERADFTAIGDTVNLASRIQSLCKVYNEPLLISGDVMRGAKEYMPSFFLLDTVRVKGRKQAIDIYSMPTRHAEAYAAALSFYRSANFEDAERAFENLQQIDPHNFVYKILIDRCKKIKPPQRHTGTAYIQ